MTVASRPLPFQVTVNATNAQPLGRQLAAFTSRAAHFSDVMDVIFVTHLVERLTRLVGQRKDVRRLRRFNAVISMDRGSGVRITVDVLVPGTRKSWS